MSSEEPIFVIKSSPCQQPWRSFCRRGCRPQQAQKKALHVNSKVTLTVNGNFCSSISRNELERSFMSTPRDGLHSLTYIHYDGAEARMPQTPRHRHAKQLHERLNYQVHTCCQYIGEVILAQLEDHRQTLHGRRSNIWHPTVFLLEQSVHDVRGRHFLTIATSPRHIFVHARGPRSDREPRSAAAMFVHWWRHGAAQMSRCHRNSVVCIQMYAWDPWTRLNGPECRWGTAIPLGPLANRHPLFVGAQHRADFDGWHRYGIGWHRYAGTMACCHRSTGELAECSISCALFQTLAGGFRSTGNCSCCSGEYRGAWLSPRGLVWRSPAGWQGQWMTSDLWCSVESGIWQSILSTPDRSGSQRWWGWSRQISVGPPQTWTFLHLAICLCRSNAAETHGHAPPVPSVWRHRQRHRRQSSGSRRTPLPYADCNARQLRTVRTVHGGTWTGRAGWWTLSAPCFLGHPLKWFILNSFRKIKISEKPHKTPSLLASS